MKQKKIKEDARLIKELGDSMGYGHLMSIASALWRQSLIEKDIPENGAFIPVCRVNDKFFDDKNNEKMYDDFVKDIPDTITGKLKKMCPSLTRDFKDYGNMVSLEDAIHIPNLSFGQQHRNDLLLPITSELVKNNVKYENIWVGTMIDDTWGWTLEDIDNEIVASTLWVKTEDDNLMQLIKNRYSPDEFSKFEGKYRLWWD